MVSSQPSIELNGLSKRYGRSAEYAVKDLKLQVSSGEVYGFLGPNGAGKSTTIRMLLNFIQPTEGSATIVGKDIVKDSVEIKKSVGYLAGDVNLYNKMTGHQFLDYMAQLQKPKRAGFRAELVKRFQAQPASKISNLSKGNRQKIGLIQAFMHEPNILILDEPTSGLDPLMQEEFFKLIHESRERGASVFFSSHNLAEIQKTCDRVGFIREGKLIAEQTIADVAAVAARTFDINFADDVLKSELKAIPGAKVESTSPRQATIHMKGDLAPMFRVLARHKVSSINQRELSLEDEFLHFYKGEKR